MTTTWTPEQRAEYAKRLPRKRAVACLVAYHGGGLLVVKPTYREGGLLPGGTVEAGKSPAAGCVRETWEELGLVLPIRQLLLVDHAPDPGDGSHFGRPARRFTTRVPAAISRSSARMLGSPGARPRLATQFTRAAISTRAARSSPVR